MRKWSGDEERRLKVPKYFLFAAKTKNKKQKQKSN